MYKIKNLYNEKLLKNGLNSITTEIKQLTNYYLAEIYHQQYLSKNPNGYCGLDGTGIKCSQTHLILDQFNLNYYYSKNYKSLIDESS